MAPNKNQDNRPASEWDLPAPAINDHAARSQVPDETIGAPLPVQQPAPADPSAPEPTVPVAGSSSDKGSGRRKKTVLAIVLATLAVLLVGAAAAYAYYAHPDRTIGDAFAKAMTAETIAAKGSFTITTEGGDVTVDYTYAGSDRSGHKAVIDVKLDMAPMAFNFAGEFLISKDGDNYFKIDNAKKIVENTFGVFAEEGQLDGVVTLVDSKWVKIPASEFNNGEVNPVECATTLDQATRSNRNVVPELKEVYMENRFIVIDETLASETVNGTDSVHYRLKFDEAKLKSFAAAFKQTQLHKELQKCDDGFTIDEGETADIVKGFNDSRIEVWIGRWSHQLTRITAIGGRDGSKFTMLAEPTFNEPVDVKSPAEFTTYEELQRALEEAFGTPQDDLVRGMQTSQPSRLQ